MLSSYSFKVNIAKNNKYLFCEVTCALLFVIKAASSRERGKIIIVASRIISLYFMQGSLLIFKKPNRVGQKKR